MKENNKTSTKKKENKTEGKRKKEANFSSCIEFELRRPPKSVHNKLASVSDSDSSDNDDPNHAPLLVKHTTHDKNPELMSSYSWGEFDLDKNLRFISDQVSVPMKKLHLKRKLPECPVTYHEGEFITTVGNYQIGESLGSGTGGVVYVGTHIETGEKVAVKVGKKSPKCRDRHKREYTVMSRLVHKNIIKLVQVVENENWLCLIMQFAENGDLFDYILDNNGLPVEEARRIFKQILDGLRYIHGKGLFHRDIKPENIFLDGGNNPLIGDFGFSDVWSSFQQNEGSLGTLQYCSPEILSDSPSYVGPEVDLWSVGALLFTMLTAQFPFGSKTDEEVLQKILHGRWNRHKDITGEVEDLLNKLLTVDPLKRASMVDVLQHPWLNPS
eukprot:CAMPEP_0174254426 /NCGR_PEP_ID=MMETSP0439-20130205/3745_1 /TAXON_ID=0 /ORGANISM="Stereomyxa ramosa, Strain Chinc5" /LENGTH=383 /DNA_ID=CAMNT_0015335993 /DNA_START=86 /DNA_END=1237 /DNA_ORIENTATION=+